MSAACPKSKVLGGAESGYARVDNEIIDLCLRVCKDGKPAGVNGMGVYLVLATYANYETETCFPSIATICKRTLLSKNTVLATLRRLIEVGAIEKTSRTSSRGDADNNVYTLLNVKVGSATVEPPSAVGDLPSATVEPPVVQPLNQGSATVEPEVALHDEHKKKKPKITKTPTLLDVPDDFIELWDAYIPIENSRGLQKNARKAWEDIRALPEDVRPSHAELLQAIKTYIAVKHAKTEYNATMRMDRFLSVVEKEYEQYLPANYHPEQQATKHLPVNITPTGGTNNVSRFASRVRSAGTE